ncbi:MAG: iron-containing alcohol dehydrogenase family protein [Armatimonadota bacterium]
MAATADVWRFADPTEIHFGRGARITLPGITQTLGRRPVLVTDSGLAELPIIEDLRERLPADTPVFADIEPNPTVEMVDALSEQIREHDADLLVAAGGGSSLDCAKAAGSVSQQGGPARKYHSEGGALDERHLPLIAIPTTAGTGSEVTPIAVLDDPEKGVKAPLVHDNFFPAVALVDPALTESMPPKVTASTGFDALAHAVEGYWSRNHNPISDALALEAVRLFFEHMPRVMQDGSDLAAREGMSLAALLGGMAFQAPKNAAVHACSFPFSATYHLPHGTACALTLDHFMRFNAPAMGGRGERLARAGGFETMAQMADAFAAMKARSGLPTRLSDFGVTTDDIPVLVEGSFHPLMENNPREVTPEQLAGIYRRML